MPTPPIGSVGSVPLSDQPETTTSDDARVHYPEAFHELKNTFDELRGLLLDMLKIYKELNLTGYVLQRRDMVRCINSFEEQIDLIADGSLPHGKIEHSLRTAQQLLIAQVQVLLDRVENLNLDETNKVKWKGIREVVIDHRLLFEERWNEFVALAVSIYESNHRAGGINRDGIPRRGEWLLGIGMINGNTCVGLFARGKKTSREPPKNMSAEESRKSKGKTGPPSEVHTLDVNNPKVVEWFLGLDADANAQENASSVSATSEEDQEMMVTMVRRVGKDADWLSRHLISLLSRKQQATSNSQKASHVTGSVYAVRDPGTSVYKKGLRIVRMTGTSMDPLLMLPLDPSTTEGPEMSKTSTGSNPSKRSRKKSKKSKGAEGSVVKEGGLPEGSKLSIDLPGSGEGKEQEELQDALSVLTAFSNICSSAAPLEVRSFSSADTVTSALWALKLSAER